MPAVSSTEAHIGVFDHPLQSLLSALHHARIYIDIAVVIVVQEKMPEPPPWHLRCPHCGEFALVLHPQLQQQANTDDQPAQHIAANALQVPWQLLGRDTQVIRGQLDQQPHGKRQ